MTGVVVIVGAVIVGVFSIARLTRLVTQDSFPPSVWLRMKWDDITNDGPWSILAHCHFCMSFWITIPIFLWGWLSDLHTAWWVFNGIFAASYAAAMTVERDEVE